MNRRFKRLRKVNGVVYTSQTVAIAGNDCQQTYAGDPIRKQSNSKKIFVLHITTAVM